MKGDVQRAKEKLLSLRMAKVEHEVLIARLQNNSSRQAILDSHIKRLDEELIVAKNLEKNLDDAESKPDAVMENMYTGTGGLFGYFVSMAKGKSSLQILRENYATVQSRISTLREIIEREQHGDNHGLLSAQARLAEVTRDIADTAKEVDRLSEARDKYEATLLEDRLFAHGCDQSTSTKLIKAMQGARRSTAKLTSSSASLAAFYKVANNMFVGMKDLTAPSILAMANQVLMFAVIGEYANSGVVTILDDPLTMRFVERQKKVYAAISSKVLADPNTTSVQVERVQLLKTSIEADDTVNLEDVDV